MWDAFLIMFFLGMNFFFVASEFAFVRVRVTHMTTLANQGSKRAKRVLDIIHDLDRSMSSTQLGISFASLGIGFIAEKFFTGILISLMYLLGVNLDLISNIEGFGFVIGYFLGTYLHVVVGELVPKSIAIRFAEKTALFCAEPLYWFMKTTNWFLYLLIVSSNLVLRLVGIPPAQETFGEVYSEDELKLIIENSIEGGELEEYESKLIYNIFEFTDTTAKEILTPRHEVAALPDTAKIHEVIELAKKTGHSRFPVYHEELDDIIGFIHIKDALIYYEMGNGTKEHTVSEHLRPVITVHEGYPIDDLLKDMQKQQTQVAVIVDEYGNLQGIITIEDILEAIVGPIKDEFDSLEKQDEETTDDEGIVVAGTIPIDEFNDLLKKYNIKTEIHPKSDVVTLAGYILEKLESKIPKKGQVIDDGNLFFKILEMDKNRIEKVEVSDHLIMAKHNLNPKQNENNNGNIKQKNNELNQKNNETQEQEKLQENM